MSHVGAGEQSSPQRSPSRREVAEEETNKRKGAKFSALRQAQGREGAEVNAKALSKDERRKGRAAGGRGCPALRPSAYLGDFALNALSVRSVPAFLSSKFNLPENLTTEVTEDGFFASANLG